MYRDRATIIHLDSATERLPLLAAIQETLPCQVDIFSAKDGVDWSKSNVIAKTHPWTKTPVKIGELGCAQSHLCILEMALKAGEKRILIFEDDCELLGTSEEISAFLENAPEKWDILLLGANEYVEYSLLDTYVKVGRFWGTHAMVLSMRAMAAAIQVFTDAQAKGEFLPADWMYNEAIKKMKLSCYAPKKPDALCRQKPGLVSAINGKIRNAPSQLPS
jgi:GR25 family glycosyltransferase involved in LPS biosynthesis